jgi:hypothetical protein
MAKRAEVPDWETLLAHAAALQAKIPSVGGGRIRLPTVGETLRIKTFLMVDRNATRDYLDVAALSVSLGLRKSAMALERMNEIYSEFAGERGDMLTSALVKLAAPDPYDLTDDLTEDKGIIAPWNNWRAVQTQCASFAAAILSEPLAETNPRHRRPFVNSVAA